MLSCNGLLVRREWGACIEFESKLLIRQAASVEPSRGSHQYRATHRNWKEGSELSSQRHPLGYRKDLRLALYFLDSCLSYRFALTCSGRQSRPSLKLPP